MDEISDMPTEQKAEEFGRMGVLLLLSAMAMCGSLALLSNPAKVQTTLEQAKEMIWLGIKDFRQAARLITVENVDTLLAYVREFAEEDALAVLKEAASGKEIRQLHKLAKLVREASKKLGRRALQADEMAVALNNWKRTTSIRKTAEAVLDWSKYISGAEDAKSFRDMIEIICDRFGTTVEKFNHIRPKKASRMNRWERDLIQAIRETIPDIKEDTYLQKVIPMEDVPQYIRKNGYNTIRGFFTRHEDVSHISGYKDIVESLRLDYKTHGVRPYPENGNSYGYIKFKTKDIDLIETPFGKLLGGNCTEGAPCTQNGFTGARNGEIIPEWSVEKGVELSLENGAELHTVINGKDTIIAIFDGNYFQAIE